MSILLDAMDYVTTTLSDAGLNVVTDPRNVQPPCVIIDPPSLVAISGNLVTTDIAITAVAPPPGNLDAVRWLLTAADTVVQAVLITNGQPGSYTIGTTDLPAYTLTARITMQRNP